MSVRSRHSLGKPPPRKNEAFCNPFDNAASYCPRDSASDYAFLVLMSMPGATPYRHRPFAHTNSNQKKSAKIRQRHFFTWPDTHFFFSPTFSVSIFTPRTHVHTRFAYARLYTHTHTLYNSHTYIDMMYLCICNILYSIWKW